jgi:hypothetical protein
MTWATREEMAGGILGTSEVSASRNFLHAVPIAGVGGATFPVRAQVMQYDSGRLAFPGRSPLR